MIARTMLKAAVLVPALILISMFSQAFDSTTRHHATGISLIAAAAAAEGHSDYVPAPDAEAGHEADDVHGGGHHGPVNISIFWIIPFAGILLSIAIIPLINGHWWHHNFPKVSLLFGLPMAILMFITLQEKTIHVFVEYCSFIALVGSLFVISGGILVRGSFKSSPMTNTLFLLIGSVIASFIGTAGASMVLIRPMLRINKNRKTKLHIFIFFIFTVSNIGGSLTPLGDPPLFLGFLQGVPFEWTLIHMLPGWAFAIGILLALFYLVDSIMIKKDGGVPADAPNEPKQKFAILGSYNFIFLLGVMGTVIFYGTVLRSMEHLGFIRDAIQVVLMSLMAFLSLKVTPKPLREENGFSWFPVKEVAVLFAAIFACMIPALNILEYKGMTGALSLSHAWQYFWMTGVLSAFLDNAPTYLTFLSLGKTLGGAGCVAVYGGCVPQHILLAIAMGAVFFGAMSYIGNAPNFMVKSICEENKVPMPSFIGYMGWSICILFPIFAIVTFIFFRG
ncbi:MAG TPA: sodium:proton antiporter [bacterium]|nr:MAG: Citrate transporter [bacterium ADurb.Bin236]HPI75360.1 sodium:proton antiporter [bacterium]HPN93298.1 sodium:proton antiporter [bacterium]